MATKVYAILAAGGSGRRFSTRKHVLPKQFLKLHNKPIILYSLVVLQKCEEVNYIIVCADKKYFSMINKFASDNKITKFEGLAEGGKTRFESVKNAFRKINGNKNDFVLIHDAVRPFITVPEVTKIILEAKKEDAVTFGVKVNETVKKAANDFISRSVKRDNLWLIQTPQVFRYDVLLSAYKRNRKKYYTDESSLIESEGYKVKLLEGSKENIKITTKEDFKLAKRIIKKGT